MSDSRQAGGKFGKGNPYRITTHERASMLGQKGNKKSQETARRRRKIKEAMLDILSLPLIDENEADRKAKEILALYGIEDAQQADALALAMLLKAKLGDVEAAKFARDSSGERPTQGVEVGNLDDRPFESIDLGKLSDDELQRMAFARRDEDETELKALPPSDAE